MISTLKNTSFKKAALIAGCFFMWGCANDFQQVRDLGNKKPGKEEAYNVTAFTSEGAKSKAKLTSPVMIKILGDTEQMIFPKTLHVEFYNDSTAKAESWLFAKYAVNYVRMGKVLLQDSVVVYNIKGDTLRTNELWWDRNKQMFYTDKKVHVKQNGSDLHGTGLTSDQAFKDIKIFHPTGPLTVQDSAFKPR